MLERLEDAERRLEEACEEINVLNAALEGAKQTNDDLVVQCKFWRQAAEHAVTGWNALEDKYETLLEATRNAEACLANTLAYVAPPDDAAPAEQSSVDLGDGVKLRLVEDEEPL